MKQYGSIEKILPTLDSKKHPVAEDWPYAQARKLFQEPDVTHADQIDLKWSKPDVEGIVVRHRVTSSRPPCQDGGFPRQWLVLLYWC